MNDNTISSDADGVNFSAGQIASGLNLHDMAVRYLAYAIGLHFLQHDGTDAALIVADDIRERISMITTIVQGSGSVETQVGAIAFAFDLDGGTAE